MTGPATTVPLSVELADIGGLGDQLGRGGEATVHDAPGVRLADAPGPLVYKKYRAPQDRSDDLRRLVALRARLAEADRDFLDERTTWPLRVVESGGVPVGVLMRRIPVQFGDRVTSHVSKAMEWSIREVGFLFIDPARLGGRVVGRQVPTWEQRLGVCRDFAHLLDFYHRKLRVIFGDINARNELYRLDGRPSVLFIDCDGVRPSGAVLSAQLNAPDWDPPGGGPLGLYTDRYKLGLYVLRSLAPGAQSSVRRDPAGAAGVLDAEGMGLLTKAIDSSRAHQEQPTAEEWWRYFSKLLGEPVDPPVLTEVRLDRGFVVRGQPVLLHWGADDARTLDVVVDGRTTSIDARAGGGVEELWLDRSVARIDVVAANGLGEASAQVGPVAVIPPPRIEPVPVALPMLPVVQGAPVALPEYTGPRMPELVLPAMPSAAPTGAPRPFAWPDLASTSFPFDLTDLLLGGPALGAGLFTEPEGKA
ncbi:hypothetical protein [Actinokineospora inagensis]|uniref:hypothetical protein n=1 Tax=Actinokineospora inagensis TaxID=103730 RepID=UPI000427C3EC|nr:hypothetical protein [Actinokineospora inagensis]